MSYCNRCGKEDNLISFGTNFYLCGKCMRQINEISNLMGNSDDDKGEYIKSYEPDSTNAGRNLDLNPRIIKSLLDDYVIGQEETKKILAVASYNHYKRTKLNDNSIQKSNVLMIGPTGCGKTHLVKTLAKILDVPVAVTPATNLTEAGYVGNDAESVVQNLLNAAGGDVEKAQKGIIFIDEVDKLTSRASSGARKEVGGTGVQQALLPIIEGCSVQLQASGTSKTLGSLTAPVTVDTSNILFICGGAFPDLEKIINNRSFSKSSIGFSVECNNEESIENDGSHVFSKVTSEDLKEFGLIPEFIGRLPVITSLENLSVDTLRKILTEPKDSLVKQYRSLFAYDGIELLFEDEALDYVATKAKEKNTGARALRSEMEAILNELMFSLPGTEVKSVCVTREYAEGKSKVPVLDNRQQCSMQII